MTGTRGSKLDPGRVLRAHPAPSLTSPAPGTSRRVSPRVQVRAGIAGVASYLPELIVTSDDVERRITEASRAHGFEPRAGVVLERTGIEERRYRAPGEQASDFAVNAARIALERAGLEPTDLDLVIFASSSQDLVEPATSHLVNHKLGAGAMVFDVKNACNSFMNGIQVADAMIRTGQYERVLVCTGEVPSEAIRWDLRDWAHMKESFAGYTFGDAGAAMVLEPCVDGTGLRSADFVAASQNWELCTLRGGGTMHSREHDASYFQGDGNSLRDAFIELGPGILLDFFRRTRTRFDDYDLVLIHQVTAPFLDVFREVSGVPEHQFVRTVDRLGNIASASMPLQLDVALRDGRVGPGANVLWIGVGAGISVGVMHMRL